MKPLDLYYVSSTFAIRQIFNQFNPFISSILIIFSLINLVANSFLVFFSISKPSFLLSSCPIHFFLCNISQLNHLLRLYVFKKNWNHCNNSLVFFQAQIAPNLQLFLKKQKTNIVASLKICSVLFIYYKKSTYCTEH